MIRIQNGAEIEKEDTDHIKILLFSEENFRFHILKFQFQNSNEEINFSLNINLLQYFRFLIVRNKFKDLGLPLP